MSGAALVTSTVAVADCSGRARSMVSVWPTCSVRPDASTGLKPEAVAVTL